MADYEDDDFDENVPQDEMDDNDMENIDDGGITFESEEGKGDDAVVNDDEEDDAAMFADLKKKKKKKKAVPEDFDEAAAAPSNEENAVDPEEEALITDLKKKKKKKINFSEFEEQLGADEDDNKKSKKPQDEDFDDLGGDNDESAEPWIGSDRDYTYEELLRRAFRLIREANPDFGGESRKYVMVPPQVLRDGVKKTVFANLNEIAKRMHRNPNHVEQFLFAELGTSGSTDGAGRLIIKGRFQQKQIENVLRKYIVEYVTCKICKSPDTILAKDNRLTFVQCEHCKSLRTVAAIKSGFSAQVGRRKKV